VLFTGISTGFVEILCGCLHSQIFTLGSSPVPGHCLKLMQVRGLRLSGNVATQLTRDYLLINTGRGSHLPQNFPQGSLGAVMQIISKRPSRTERAVCDLTDGAF
jgi:hypothetical protein